jgi:hypothetical protein
VSVTDSDYTEADLNSLSRADLDEIATTLELDPADYATKADEVAAILEAQAAVDQSLEPSTTEEEGEEAVAPATFAGVDIASIEATPGVLGPDEHVLLSGESWVVLGAAPDVPDWAVGKPAAVSYAPVSTAPEGYQYTAPDAIITVRERSQGATFSVPLDTVEEVYVSGGRGSVVNFP